MIMKNYETTSTASFETVARRYIEEKKATVKTSTYVVYLKNLEDFILPNLEKIYSMEEISTPETLTILDKKFKEKGYSETLINRLITFIRSIVRFYRRMEEYEGIAIITKNNAFNLLTNNEVRFIYKKAVANADEVKYLGVLIAMYTGMPVSEICALKWSDIDLERSIIYVCRDVNRVPYPNGVGPNNERTFVHVKDKVTRIIPIHKDLKNVLTRYYDKSKGNYYVISNSDGIVEPRTFEIFVSKAFDKKVRIGDLRDWFCIKSIQCGVSLQVMSKLTGVSIPHFIKKYEVFINVSEEDMKHQINKLMLD